MGERQTSKPLIDKIEPLYELTQIRKAASDSVGLVGQPDKQRELRRNMQGIIRRALKVWKGTFW